MTIKELKGILEDYDDSRQVKVAVKHLIADMGEVCLAVEDATNRPFLCLCPEWIATETNADKIRCMSDEELADFLGDWARRHLAWMQDDRGEVLWWLQQNV